MTQKAQHTYQDDYSMQAVGNASSSQNGWIWASLAAIAILGLGVWFLASSSPSSGPVSSAPQTEQIAPAPDAAPAPAPAPAAPTQ